MDSALRRVARGMLYWACATCLVVGLMFTIFFLASVAHQRSSVQVGLAPMFVLVGLVLLVVSMRALATPGSPIPTRVERPTRPAYPVPVGVTGLSLVTGGLLYGLTGEVHLILYSVVAGVALLTVVSMVLGSSFRGRL